MASVVDVCNVSLSNIGHGAGVVSIDPPDGSAYSAHCARFYPIARDEVLETHPWRFALKRAQLALSGTAPDSWNYQYAMPSDCIRVLSVLPDGYSDDMTQTGDYVLEGDYLLTNTQLATLHYISRVTDTSKWSPSFASAVSWKMSQYLSGAIVKGDAPMRGYCAKQYQESLMIAMGFNAQASKTRPAHVPVWMQDR